MYIHAYGHLSRKIHERKGVKKTKKKVRWWKEKREKVLKLYFFRDPFL